MECRPLRKPPPRLPTTCFAQMAHSPDVYPAISTGRTPWHHRPCPWAPFSSPPPHPSVPSPRAPPPSARSVAVTATTTTHRRPHPPHRAAAGRAAPAAAWPLELRGCPREQRPPAGPPGARWVDRPSRPRRRRHRLRRRRRRRQRGPPPGSRTPPAAATAAAEWCAPQRRPMIGRWWLGWSCAWR